MNVKEITMGIVATIVALVIVVVCAIPIISESVDPNDTFKNEGSFELTYNQPDSITLEWDHTVPGTITVNDEAITMPTLTNGESRTVLCGDDWIIRYGYGTSLGGNYIQWYPSTGASITASVNNGLDLVVTCDSGTVTVTDTATTPNTATASYTYFYCVANDGDYVMKNGSETVYVTGDTTVYAMGLTNVGTYTSTGIKIEGTIDDGMTWSVFRGNAEYTFSDEEIHYTEVGGYIGLYSLESMTATVTAGDQSVDAVYSYFIVPSEISAEKAVHADSSVTSILSVIPVMMVLAILIGAVGMFIKTRRD